MAVLRVTWRRSDHAVQMGGCYYQLRARTAIWAVQRACDAAERLGLPVPMSARNVLERVPMDHNKVYPFINPSFVVIALPIETELVLQITFVATMSATKRPSRSPVYLQKKWVRYTTAEQTIIVSNMSAQLFAP